MPTIGPITEELMVPAFAGERCIGCWCVRASKTEICPKRQGQQPTGGREMVSEADESEAINLPDYVTRLIKKRLRGQRSRDEEQSV